MNTRWSSKAIHHLDKIFQYIAADNEEAAHRMMQRIGSAIVRAAQMPYSARAGLTAGTRELVVPGAPYIIVYRIREETIHILAVWHGAQKRPKSL